MKRPAAATTAAMIDPAFACEPTAAEVFEPEEAADVVVDPVLVALVPAEALVTPTVMRAVPLVSTVEAPVAEADGSVMIPEVLEERDLELEPVEEADAEEIVTLTPALEQTLENAVMAASALLLQRLEICASTLGASLPQTVDKSDGSDSVLTAARRQAGGVAIAILAEIAKRVRTRGAWANMV